MKAWEAERERRMVARALDWRELTNEQLDARILMLTAKWEAERVANAEVLASQGRQQGELSGSRP